MIASKNRLLPMFKISPYKFFLIALSSHGLTAFAQESLSASRQTLARCLHLSDNQARLACYDQTLASHIRDEPDLSGNPPVRERRPARLPDSALNKQWELTHDSKTGRFHLHPYKPLYLLPIFHTTATNPLPHSPNPRNTLTTALPLDDTEAKYQLSFKTRIASNLFGRNGDVWAAYTQSSRWQVYNSGDSRPFRETNYEPEVLFVFRNGYSLGRWKGRMSAISFSHQSNGRSNPHSRSWNRVIASIGLEREQWVVLIRPWLRLSEPLDDDDNPDISDYMGRADFNLTWSHRAHEVSLMMRHSLRRGERSHGAARLDWSFPLHRQFYGYVQVFSGYGESMIDYNHRATYIGLGISLPQWF